MINIFMKAFRNSYLAALLLITMGASAQKYTYNPGYFQADSYFGKYNIRPGIRDTTAIAGKVDSVGAIVYWPGTKALWNKTDTGWTRLAGGINPAGQIDTLSFVDSLGTYSGQSNVLFVTDPWRGGFFVKKSTGAADDILVFEAADANYWHRVYNPEDGILIDWAGADPTGVNNSSPAIAAIVAKYNNICARAGGTYLLSDSITIPSKTNFVFDGKGATFTEGQSFYSTIVVKPGTRVVLKNMNFDGPEDYTYFLTSDPSSPKQYLYIDSSDIVTVTGIVGRNKRGLITFSSCSNVNFDDWAQEGIFKNGIASNVLGAFGVRTIGYGFVDPTHYLVFGSISNGRVRNAGCPILIGDNTTYISITNNHFDTTYNNGIYISSALWATVTGNVMRKVGGTGIKARGLGFTITGNVVTNSDLGISVSGNNIEPFYAAIPTKYGTNGYSELVANNIIDTVSTRGLDVDFQDGGATHNTTVANNTVKNNLSTTDYLLKVNTAGGTQIMGNKLQGSLATIASYFQRTGTDSTQTNIISNNIFRDCAGQALHFQGLKRSLVSGNVFDSLGASALVFDNSTGNKITDNIYKAGTVVHALQANGNSDNVIEGNTGAITADNLTSILLNNYPNVQQNITVTPRLLGQTAISGGNIYIAANTTSSAGWTQLTPAARTISTTAPLAGGGALTGNLTLSIPAATSSQNGYLTSGNWTTFNSKIGPGDTASMLGNYIVSASNGLTKSSKDVRLGGTLNTNTTIASGSNTLSFTSAGEVRVVPRFSNFNNNAGISLFASGGKSMSLFAGGFGTALQFDSTGNGFFALVAADATNMANNQLVEIIPRTLSTFYVDRNRTYANRSRILNNLVVGSETTGLNDSAYFFGNSITVGVGTTATNFRWSTHAAYQLNEIENNFGLSSSTMQKGTPDLPLGAASMIDRLNLIPTKSSLKKYLVFAYGLNDMGYNGGTYDTVGFKAAYRRVLDTSIARGWSPSDILLVAPYFVNDSGYRRYDALNGGNGKPTVARHLQYVDATLKISQQYGTKYIDMYQAMLANGADALLSSDSLHPNNDGHAFIAKTVAAALTRSAVDQNNYIQLGSRVRQETDSAAYLNMGGSYPYSFSPSTLKLKLLDLGVGDAGIFGIGPDYGRMNYYVSTGSSHVFHMGDTTMTIGPEYTNTHRLLLGNIFNNQYRGIKPDTWGPGTYMLIGDRNGSNTFISANTGGNVQIRSDGNSTTKTMTVYGATGDVVIGATSDADNGVDKLQVVGSTRLSGGVKMPIISTSGSVTLTTSNMTVIVTNTAHVVTLPLASSCTGQVFNLVNYNTGGNVTISSVLRDGSATTIFPNNAKWTVQSNGTSWYVIKD